MMDNKGGIGSDDEDDGPLIPDLDDVRDEDMAFQVADAPSVAVNRYVAANLHYTIRTIICYQILKKCKLWEVYRCYGAIKLRTLSQ